MSLHSWLQNLRSALTPGLSQGRRRQRRSPRTATHRLNVEALEDRLTPSFNWVGTFPTGTAAPYAMVTGGFNNDGNLDVATAAETYKLLPGNGGWLDSPPEPGAWKNTRAEGASSQPGPAKEQTNVALVVIGKNIST